MVVKETEPILVQDSDISFTDSSDLDLFTDDDFDVEDVADLSPRTEPRLEDADDLEMNFTDSDSGFDFSDDDNCMEEESVGSSEVVTPFSKLVEMGFRPEDALAAIEKSGKQTPMEELVQFICASKCCDAQGNPPESSSKHLMMEAAGSSSGNGSLIADLIEMGYKYDEASAAVDRCGSDTPMAELTDFIEAARFRDDGDTFEQDGPSAYLIDCSMKRKKTLKQRKNVYKDETIRMVGFGIPNMPGCRRISLPKIASGPPYFYFENVACTPVGVWKTIEKSLYGIDAEFVDSQHFTAACRKRGYVHNLPVENRFQLTPIAPATIHEAFPETVEWWPLWDTRKKLNCLLTCIGSAPLTKRIKTAIEENSKGDTEPPEWVKKYVMRECRKWNMIWVRQNTVAPLEPRQMEELMGFPVNHTRGGCSLADRYTFLGNSFQIDTVAFHLSPLKGLYAGGVNVLSLFSGIGGAEVALYRLGIPIKNVVSVETNKRCQEILQSWWKQTRQKGNLIQEVHDVTEVSQEMLVNWISRLGCFDLVIGGSPCNNLAGGNRHSRVGLQGEHSSLFFHYVRILKAVRNLQNGT